MYLTRCITVLCLILILVVAAYGPQGSQEASRSWESARPIVVQWMDGIYTIIRSLVAGPEPKDDLDDLPEVDFDRVITMKRGVLG